MNLLLDTPAFLWFMEGSERISRRAREAIEGASGVRVLSERLDTLTSAPSPKTDGGAMRTRVGPPPAMSRASASTACRYSPRPTPIGLHSSRAHLAAVSAGSRLTYSFAGP